MIADVFYLEACTYILRPDSTWKLHLWLVFEIKERPPTRSSSAIVFFLSISDEMNVPNNFLVLTIYYPVLLANFFNIVPDD